MTKTKSLIKDSVIYGGSSILQKMVSWLMTFLFTATLIPEEFGIMTNLYAYIGLIIVMLTFGMETGFFRFANQKEKYNPMLVYSTVLLAVGTIVFVFFLISQLFLPQFRSLIWDDHIPDNYIRVVILILSLDAFRAIPMAFLRYKKRPIKFATVNILNVVLYALLCIFFLRICPWINEKNPDLISWFYNPEFRLGYVFISNLIAAVIQTACIIPELTGFKYKFDRQLAKQMFWYCLPLLLMGIAGVGNQVADKILFPHFFSNPDIAFAQLGIYSACFKIAQIMMMFTQAFRYAYEPFIFEKSKDENAEKAYADVMKYFVLFGLFIFMGVVFYLDIIKNMIGSLSKEYWEALGVVPIILIGELFFAIYFNLSIWYKIKDKTYWGGIFSVIGCLVIVLVNLIFIPKFGYWACAWASLVGNGVIMLLSYFVGQKYYPIKYDLKTIGLYCGLTFVLYAISYYIPIKNEGLQIGFNTVLILIYLFVLVKRDLPLKEIPYINRFVKHE